MPISPLILQRRHSELGRIRLGDKGAKGQPQKLQQFRFTSPSDRYIRDLATLYGGDARAWDNNGKSEFEVYTTATTVPVIVVKGGLSQWMEVWSGGGCTHRCDGVTNAITGDACDPDDRVHQAAKPTTRLSVMLPELEAIGVFRMESHGWNAAAEIPAVAELAQFAGDLVPAHLNLVERRSVRDGKTSRFVVPVLDLQIGAARLREIVAVVQQHSTGGPVAVEASEQRPALAAAPPERPALEARPTFDVPGMVAACDTLDDCRGVWQDLAQSGQLDDSAKALLQARVALLQPPAPAAAPADPPVPVDEEAAWMRCLAEGGRLGLDLAAVKDAYSQWTQGELVDDADGKRLAEFADHLATQQAAA